MAEPLTLYKLMVLYMLDKVTFPLTNNQISEFILTQGYTDYFHVQQALSDLVETELIHMDTIRNTSQYHLTENGAETLSFFGKEISPDIKKDIDNFLQENAYELRNEVNTTADYYLNSEQEYCVRCKVHERNQDLIDLTITVPTEDAAIHACDNWKKNSQKIYASVIANLL